MSKIDMHHQTTAANPKLFRIMLEQKGMTQRRLATEMGLDPASVSLMIRGKRKLQLAEAKQMAEILHVHLADVLLAAGIQTYARLESGGLQEALRRLIEHSSAHMRECIRRGEMAAAESVMGDIKTAMTMLSTMIDRGPAEKD